MRRRIIRRNSKATFYDDAGFGEFYVGASGVTFSDPRIKDGVVDDEDVCMSEIEKPWFEDESRRIIDALDTSSVLIEGDLGAGKSSAIYGLRTLLRTRHTPYVHIDGHFTNRADKQRPAIHSAMANNRDVIIFDSFDYLFVRQAFNKKSSFARAALLGELLSHHESGGKLVVTMHTDPWLQAKSNSDLISQLHESIPDDIERIRVGGALEADRLKELCAEFASQEFAENYAELALQAQDTARTYRVAKQVAFRHPDIASLSLDEFCSIVETIDNETRAKMGADPDYALL